MHISPTRFAVSLITAASMFGVVAGACPSRVAAQSIEEITATPERTTEAFLRSLRALRWETVALLLADEPLERVRATVEAVVAHDSTGAIGARLVGTDAAGLAALSAPDVFARSMASVIGDMPGLTHAIYDRDDEVIGSVADGADAAHAVYRTTARISGAVPEVKVMQLQRTDLGWRVVTSDELGILEAALHGVGRQ